MTDPDERVKALEERVDKLEKQIAVLMKKLRPAPPANRSREMRDRYDSLDYPER